MTAQQTVEKPSDRTVRAWKKKARDGEWFTIRLSDRTEVRIASEGWASWRDSEGELHPCGQAMAVINLIAEGKHPFTKRAEPTEPTAPAEQATTSRFAEYRVLLGRNEDFNVDFPGGQIRVLGAANEASIRTPDGSWRDIGAADAVLDRIEKGEPPEYKAPGDSTSAKASQSGRTRVVHGNKAEIAARVLELKNAQKTPREIADEMGWKNVSSVHDYLRIARENA